MKIKMYDDNKRFKTKIRPIFKDLPFDASISYEVDLMDGDICVCELEANDFEYTWLKKAIEACNPGLINSFVILKNIVSVDIEVNNEVVLQFYKVQKYIGDPGFTAQDLQNVCDKICKDLGCEPKRGFSVLADILQDEFTKFGLYYKGEKYIEENED